MEFNVSSTNMFHASYSLFKKVHLQPTYKINSLLLTLLLLLCLYINYINFSQIQKTDLQHQGIRPLFLTTGIALFLFYNLTYPGSLAPLCLRIFSLHWQLELRIANEVCLTLLSSPAVSTIIYYLYKLTYRTLQPII